MILVNGCSFSAPADDVPSWPSGFLSKGFNKFKHNGTIQYNVVRNVATGGASNLVIRRKTFWNLHSNRLKQKPDYAIIQWSTIDRWDYPVFVDEERAKTFPRLDWRPDWVNKINYMNNGTDTFSYGKNFYEKVLNGLDTLQRMADNYDYNESFSYAIPFKSDLI